MRRFASLAGIFSGRFLHRAALFLAVTLMAVSAWEEWREDRRFQQIVVDTFHSPQAAHGVVTSQANAMLLLHHVHDVVEENTRKMGWDHSMEGQLFWAPGDHLRHPGGACASYSTVLAKALQTAGFAVRKVGLADHEIKAIHHVVETRADGHWILMDAAFDLAFNRPDGLKASARDVATHWSFYRQQTPPLYPALYNYSGYYYTNWDRIPGASLVFRFFPPLKTWVDEHEVSLRFVFLNVWSWLTLLWACVAGALLLPLWFRWPAGRAAREGLPLLADAPVSARITAP